MPDTQSVTEKLRAAFPAAQVGKLPRVTCKACSDKKRECQQHERRWCDVCKSTVSEKHIHIDYVGHGDVTDRLLDADPSWNWEPFATDESGLPKFDLDDDGHPVGLWIRLTVGEVSRPGYGSVPSGQDDAVKVLIGDALRNAAMRFGVALDLWAKGDRANPSAENATASAGKARRGQRRDESWRDQPPVQVQNGRVVEDTPDVSHWEVQPGDTDAEWLAEIRAEIKGLKDKDYAGVLWRRVHEKTEAGGCTARDGKMLQESITERINAITKQPTLDGKLREEARKLHPVGDPT